MAFGGHDISSRRAPQSDGVRGQFRSQETMACPQNRGDRVLQNQPGPIPSGWCNLDPV